MLKVVAENSQYKYIEVLIDGDINQESVSSLLSLLQQRISEWGEVHVLEEVRDIGKVELAAFWKDLRFGIKNLDKFPRAAIVTDIHWVKNISNFLDPIVQMDIEVFPRKDIDKARAWLSGVEPKDTPSPKPGDPPPTP